MLSLVWQPSFFIIVLAIISLLAGDHLGLVLCLRPLGQRSGGYGFSNDGRRLLSRLLVIPVQ